MEIITASSATTCWKNGRLDALPGPGKLLFGRMHEDVAIELDAFRFANRIFCIASAGCTAMRLAREHEVIAVDINPVQIAYVRSRLAGAPNQLGAIERGIALLQKLGPLAGWSRLRVREFLELAAPDEQVAYWQKYLDNRRFRAALNCLFSRPVLRSLYSEPLLDCLPSPFGSILRRRMLRCFALHSNLTNPYAKAILAGAGSDITLPSCRQLRLAVADAASFLERQSAETIDGFALSNILDGASPSYRKRLIAAVRRAASPRAKVVLRSFREPSSMESTNRAADDRSMIWGIVDVCPASDLTPSCTA